MLKYLIFVNPTAGQASHNPIMFEEWKSNNGRRLYPIETHTTKSHTDNMLYRIFPKKLALTNCMKRDSVAPFYDTIM